MLLQQFKALANDKRLKIIYALTVTDLCQIHIMEISRLSQVDTSRNLKVLLDSNLVTSRKKGTRVIYSLSPLLRTEYQQQLQIVKREYDFLKQEIDLYDLQLRCQNYNNDSKNNE